MPRTLTGPHGARTLSNLQWGLLVKLAYDRGWRPMGVRPPEDWNATGDDGQTKRWYFMDYFSTKRQQVVPADASAMAHAIESALPDIPEHDALSHKVVQEIQLPDMEQPLRMLQPGVQVNAFEFFSGQTRPVLIDFIAFAQRGGFTITGPSHEVFPPQS
jgi:hypothetical protein